MVCQMTPPVRGGAHLTATESIPMTPGQPWRPNCYCVKELRLTCDFPTRQASLNASLTSLRRAVTLGVFVSRGDLSLCRSERFNRTTDAAPRRTDFVRAWPLKM